MAQTSIQNSNVDITRLLEDTEEVLKETVQETTSVQKFDPAVISSIRNAMHMVARNITSVQPIDWELETESDK